MLRFSQLCCFHLDRGMSLCFCLTLMYCWAPLAAQTAVYCYMDKFWQGGLEGILVSVLCSSGSLRVCLREIRLQDACVLSHSFLSDSCDPTDCSPPGSSVHGIFQTRILSGLPFPSPGDLPDPGITPVSPASPLLAGRFFTPEPPGKPPVLR